MIDVFRYTDYRPYLRDWFDDYQRLHPAFTKRLWATRLKIDPGYLVRVLQGTAMISLPKLDDFVRVLRLEGLSAEYFRQLVRFCRAREEDEIAREYAALMALRNVEVRNLDQNQYRFFQFWWFAVVRGILSVKEFRGDYKQLAADCLPVITEEQAREAIALLQVLGLVRRLDDGVWELTEQHISTGEEWKSAAIRQYQRENMQLAMEALDAVAPEYRDVSTMTLTIQSADLPEVKARIAEFRRELTQMVLEAREMDSVFQLNIQFFPVMQFPPAGNVQDPEVA